MKRLTILWLVLFCLLVLTGCHSGKKVEPGKVTISFLDLGLPEEIHRMEDLVKRFEQDHPGVRVKVEYPPGPEQIKQKLLMRSISNMDPDVVYLNDTFFPKFIDKGIFFPLDSFIEKDSGFDLKDFYPWVIDIARFNTDKLYSLPPWTGTFVIFYNKSKFDEAGLPYPKDGWNWEEFREVCKKLTIREGDRAVQFGIGGLYPWQWFPMILQNRGKLMDENGRCVFNSPEVIEALQFCKDMYVKDKSVASPLTFASVKDMNEGQLFQTGKVALLNAGFSSFTQFKNIDWDMVAPPEKKGGLKYFHRGFWGYGITSASKNKDLAWEFIKFLTSEQTQRELLNLVIEGKYKVADMPSRVSLEKEFLESLPDKHLTSYFYAISQLPDFPQAQYMGVQPLDEVMDRYSVQDNIMGLTKEDIKTVLDNITGDVNKALNK